MEHMDIESNDDGVSLHQCVVHLNTIFRYGLISFNQLQMKLTSWQPLSLVWPDLDVITHQRGRERYKRGQIMR